MKAIQSNEIHGANRNDVLESWNLFLKTVLMMREPPLMWSFSLLVDGNRVWSSTRLSGKEVGRSAEFVREVRTFALSTFQSMCESPFPKGIRAEVRDVKTTNDKDGNENE